MAGISRAERERRDRLYERGLKQCNTCGEPLPLASYTPRQDGYKGLNGTCRDCKNMATSEYQKRTPERQTARQKLWRDENRDKWLAVSRRRDIRFRSRRDGVAA